MKNLSVADQIDKQILNTYSGLLASDAQNFIVRLITLMRTILLLPEDEDIVIEFNAARNTLAHLRAQYVLVGSLEKFERVNNITVAGHYTRIKELCERMNEDVAEFMKLSRFKVLQG